MKLLITGSTGFIGKQLVLRALTDGHQVVAIIRSTIPADWINCNNLEIIQCDLFKDPIPSLSDFNIDCVVHLAVEMKSLSVGDYADMLLGTRKLIDEIRRSGIRKLIGVSSLSVVDYESNDEYSVIDETIGISTDFHRMGKYSVLKAMQEHIITSSSGIDFDSIILRPGLVYSNKVLSYTHAGIIIRKLQILISHSGEVPLVALDNVVDAIFLAAKCSVGNNEVIHLVDDNLPVQADYLSILKKRNILKGSSIHIPWYFINHLIKFIYPIFNFFNITHFLPDLFLPHAYSVRLKPFKFTNKKAKNLLNWQPKPFQINDKV